MLNAKQREKKRKTRVIRAHVDRYPLSDADRHMVWYVKKKKHSAYERLFNEIMREAFMTCIRRIDLIKKPTIIQTLNEHCGKFNLDDFLDRLILIEKIDEETDEVKAGKAISYDKVNIMAPKWHK